MDYKKYIFPINSTTDGSGVVVGDLFITAGHVIKDGIKPSVVINGKSYPLDKENAILFDTNSEIRSDGLDVAVFRMNEICSPLHLADFIPSKGEGLLSCFYRHTVSCDSGLSSNIFSSKINEDWLFEQRKGIVTSLFDNFFECQFIESLSEGSSGSPIFYNDKVVGVLYGDKEGKNSSKTVLFLSSYAIIKKLITINYYKVDNL